MIAISVALGVALLPGGPTANAGGTGGPPASYATQGEAGTGLPPLPISVPEGASRRAKIRWSDLDPSHAWAKAAINFVGEDHSWMRDFAANPNGSYPFNPDMIETRKYFARTAVKAFAPDAVIDPQIQFPDLDPTQSFYKWANIAVQQGWMRRADDGRFMPDKPVTMIAVHRLLVLALGLRSTAAHLNGLQTKDGVEIHTSKTFGTTMLGMRLGLRYPSSGPEFDVLPSTPLPRAQVAYSLYRAKTLVSYAVPNLREEYDDAVLPRMGAARQAIVEWGLRYVGYPYVWAGEWGFDSPPPAAFGGQPIPGFDCSGWAWWALRADDDVWDVSPPRPYEGWALPQRSSSDMARIGAVRWNDLKPGDLAFYDGNDDGTVDHVDVYVGNDFALDSSTSVAGVTLMYVGPGSWYREHFVHGRQLITKR
ncbi:MAG TPA: NlpC/P60 family protein [Actinomycetota bacterium]